MPQKKILVHICCAPDALYVLSLLKEEYDAAGYFYNPNIYPEEEYRLRLVETKKVANIIKFNLIEGPFNVEEWTRFTIKYKDEPEKGRRCDICYALRLKSTAQKASELHFDCFTTVMSLSPLKKADTLNRIGRMFAKRYNIPFLEADYKKKAGFHKSVLLSREYGLYRQNYCGCSYSLMDKEK